ncbi:DUF2239 family protein [Salinarimonas soli]|uniref:DUF2239 family protein n=1 Tax=Salinarimonas soli TaxID=1638099 RepID=A0A5B2V8H8_9HYPH|nr:DUF2239 family protein [Salinarimonas soli]KAA2235793.1 DUF2239 family protein [Salinarimonas soli]
MAHPSTHTAFQGFALLARGTLGDVALAAKRAAEADAEGSILIFEDATGRQIDLDLRGSEAEVRARHTPAADPPEAAVEARGRGRPRLGVTAREVTLLPRHWDWLASRPGGASVTLRRLVDEARRRDGEGGRSGRDAAYGFMAAIAGNLPGFEEASRALFAGDRDRFEARTAGWPEDVRAHATRLAFGG